MCTPRRARARWCGWPSEASARDVDRVGQLADDQPVVSERVRGDLPARGAVGTGTEPGLIDGEPVVNHLGENASVRWNGLGPWLVDHLGTSGILAPPRYGRLRGRW